MVRGESISLGLYSVAGQTNNAIEKLNVKFGQEANAVYMPKKFNIKQAVRKK